MIYDQSKFDELGITHERTGNALRVILPGDPGAFYLDLAGGELVLLPNRSASHRQLQALLTGVKPDEPPSLDYSPRNYGQ